MALSASKSDFQIFAAFNFKFHPDAGLIIKWPVEAAVVEIYPHNPNILIEGICYSNAKQILFFFPTRIPLDPIEVLF
jgi:hypothetical protein